MLRPRGVLGAALALLVALALGSRPGGASADISVPSYCEVAIQNMQQEVSNLNESIALVNQHKADLQTSAEVEQAKRPERDRAKEALFSSFGITAEEYVAYMGKHKAEVDKYLTENPAVKQQMDSLSAQVRSMLEQYESQRAR